MADWNLLLKLSASERLEWAAAQGWARAMRDCGQDQQWHAEGDVWSHTVQVLGELQSIDGLESLDARERIVLWFAALFHDCAKPLTTIVDSVSGRVRSPKHAVKGEQLARAILRELDCPFKTREQICALVRYHGKPVFLHEDTQPEFELARLSWLTRHEWLFVLAMADLRGRSSRESNRSEDDLLWYRELARENDCLSQPLPLANSHAKVLLGRRALTNLHYAPFENYGCTVTVMSGLPGCGKDTWLRENRPELPVVSLDGVRADMDVSPEDNQGQVVQAARERCRELLRAGNSFALNATNTSRPMRTLWVDLFVQYGARIEIVAIENSLRETMRQNRERPEPVPDSVIERLHERSEPVTVLEAHEVHYVLGDDLLGNDELRP